MNFLYILRFEEWDTATDPDCDNSAIGEPPTCATAVIEIPVTETSVHPQYDSKSTEQHNDIALLRLSRKVKYNRYIQPICLPQSQNLRSLDLTGIKLLVAGWGKTQDRVNMIINHFSKSCNSPISSCKHFIY